MRKNPPAFQFYADDWIGGTFGMSYEAKGVYIDALALQWSRGRVTDSDWLTFSRLASEHAVSEAKQKFDQVEQHAWQNPRLESVRRIATARAEAGSKGGGKQNGSKQPSKTEANGEANSQAKDPPSISVSISSLQSPSPNSNSSSSSSSSNSSSGHAVMAAVSTTNWEEIWKSVEAGDPFHERVRDEANRFARLKRPIDRDLVWQACWVAVQFDRDCVAEVCEKVRQGDVRSPTSYLNAAMRKLCERNGEDWNRLKKLVPETPPLRPFPQEALA
jgi:uncharacterized protein YdaU (DUF1376 family)